MTTKQSALHYVITVILVAGLAAWMHFDAERVAQQVVTAKAQQDLALWKSKILPLYRAMDVDFEEHPETMAELLSPMFRLIEPISRPLQRPQQQPTEKQAIE